MKPVVTCWAATLLVLSACNGAPQTDSSSAKPTPAAAASPAAGQSPPYDTSLPMPELMAHVVQYAGDGVWKWQGEVLDKSGEHSLYPKNDAEWEEAESASLSLAEITNLLLLPGRRVDTPEWDEAVAAVRKVALDAARAAERQDKRAFLAAGSALNQACDTCHKRFDPNFEPPPR